MKSLQEYKYGMIVQWTLEGSLKNQITYISQAEYGLFYIAKNKCRKYTKEMMIGFVFFMIAFLVLCASEKDQ